LRFAPKKVGSAPFVIRCKLDSGALARRLPAGSTGLAAIYSDRVNNITGRKGADGSLAIQFGGCDGKIPNCLPIMKCWNYIVRLYRPRTEILKGTWNFPEPQPVN
jgi:hypothetical protein